jgi:hypothetical protein
LRELQNCGSESDQKCGLDAVRQEITAFHDTSGRAQYTGAFNDHGICLAGPLDSAFNDARGMTDPQSTDSRIEFISDQLVYDRDRHYCSRGRGYRASDRSSSLVNYPLTMEEKGVYLSILRGDTGDYFKQC